MVKPRYAYQMEAPVEKFEISCEGINEYKSSSHYDNLLGLLAKKISELNDVDINKMLNKNS